MSGSISFPEGGLYSIATPACQYWWNGTTWVATSATNPIPTTPGQITPAPSLITGSFTTSGQTSTPTAFSGLFSVFLGGTFSATVLLERSPDSGANYYPCSLDSTGTQATWTAPMSVDAEAVNFTTLYRLRCTVHASGTVVYALLQGSTTGI